MKEPSGLARLGWRLRAQGLPWLRRRLAFEWNTPTTAPGRLLFRLRARLRAMLRRRRGEAPDGDVLYAFLDLDVAPVTYDVLWFIVGAELERRRLGRRRIQFVVVPGRSDGLRDEEEVYEAAVDRDDRHWRLFNLIMPAFSLAGPCGILLAADRDVAAGVFHRQAEVFPPLYHPRQPFFPIPADLLQQAREGADCALLTAPAAARRWVARWAKAESGARRLITITLREYEFMPARNSNLAAWAQFARELDPNRWAVVFLRDTARTADPPPPELAGLRILPEASWVVSLRMALYEAAFLNLGVSGGPMMLCHFGGRTRSLMFKIITEDVPQSSTAYVTSLGFTPGETPPTAARGQRWVWEDDDLPTIRREFLAAVRDLDEGGEDSG
ncbi:hypothetical protein [Magnetospirillum sp. UT-4]|uniref:hypothetical protein n=1 Tax=Magnetospirillum sp. UT-4 TaxID=2681467 RepID=UPI001380EDD4|nr:hypothetical protein [Magnetospirillum sp. UT-4]CAA7612133.1 conserved hypothetical protein [Magnetospirillum sp. UT-4]